MRRCLLLKIKILQNFLFVDQNCTVIIIFGSGILNRVEIVDLGKPISRDIYRTKSCMGSIFIFSLTPTIAATKIAGFD